MRIVRGCIGVVAILPSLLIWLGIVGFRKLRRV